VAHAQIGPIEVGLMLPYSGTYAALGNAVENGITLNS
jgi:branched-chain amino acid transport system substrate-binding protein